MGPDGSVRRTGLHRVRAGRHGSFAAELRRSLARLRRLLHRHDAATGSAGQRRRDDRAGAVGGHAQLPQLPAAAQAADPRPAADAEGHRTEAHPQQRPAGSAGDAAPLRMDVCDDSGRSAPSCDGARSDTPTNYGGTLEMTRLSMLEHKTKARPWKQ